MLQFTSLNTAKVYLRNDIKIIDVQDSDSIRAYGNAAGQVIVEGGNNPKKVLPELIILGQALQADDPKLLADLSVIQSGYTEMIARMLAVEVPEPLINQHLLLINSLQAVKDDVEGFKKAFDDPLVAYLRTKRYKADVEGLATALDGVRVVLEKEHIVYEKTDAGGFFFTLRP